MESIWILAQNEPPAGDDSVITMEPADPEAQTTTTQTDGVNGGELPPAPPPKRNPMFDLILIGGFILLMYLIMFRGPKKKQKEHQQMVSSLQKNDRVRTIGGILGTVLDVKPDEIVLKVDEANNVKIRVVPSAVATVLTEEKK